MEREASASLPPAEAVLPRLSRRPSLVCLGFPWFGVNQRSKKGEKREKTFSFLSLLDSRNRNPTLPTGFLSGGTAPLFGEILILFDGRVGTADLKSFSFLKRIGGKGFASKN